jgi:Polyketide cyclase / dehydrase and lipid transport
VKDVSALSYRTATMIGRSAEDVFDYCSDLRSELHWNPKVKYVEKLTDGPVGVGTRYRARWTNSGPTTVEVVGFDRPRSWETSTRARGMVIRFQGTVTDVAQGARYTASLELRPRGLAWLVAPLTLLAMRRQDQQDMDRIREALEATTVTSA